MKMVPVVLATTAAIFIGIPFIGASIQAPAVPTAPTPALVNDARAAMRSDLKFAQVKEVHFLSGEGSVCGLVIHAESEIGWVPFAYSHKLGLSVAQVWGRREPENLNKRYGCQFLPLAYTDEWKTPFWGGERGDLYMPAPEAI